MTTATKLTLEGLSEMVDARMILGKTAPEAVEGIDWQAVEDSAIKALARAGAIYLADNRASERRQGASSARGRGWQPAQKASPKRSGEYCLAMLGSVQFIIGDRNLTLGEMGAEELDELAEDARHAIAGASVRLDLAESLRSILNVAEVHRVRDLRGKALQAASQAVEVYQARRSGENLT